MDEHEWIHDASCAECGVKAREVFFDPHPLEPLEGGLVDKDGVFWPTCARCGRIHYNQWPGVELRPEVQALRARVKELEALLYSLYAPAKTTFGATLEGGGLRT